jgi:hypothetical protein
MQIIPAGRGVGQGAIVEGSSGGITTASATFVDMTDMTITLNNLIVGSMLEVDFVGLFSHNTPAASTLIGFSLDGAAAVGQMGFQELSSNYQFTLGSFYMWTVTASSHTVKVQWSTTGATATNTNNQRMLRVKELKTV